DLLPFMEEGAIYTRAVTAAFPTPGYGVWDGLQGTPVKKYMCPADTTSDANNRCTTGDEVGDWAATSYSLNYYLFGTHIYTTPLGGQANASKYKISNVPDGTSNTIALVERSSSFPGSTKYAAAYAGGPVWNDNAPIYGWWPSPPAAP